MSANFKGHLGTLPNFLFPNGAAEQPKLVAGIPVLAGDVAGHAEIYVDLLNSDENLSPQSISQVNYILFLFENDKNNIIFYLKNRLWQKLITLLWPGRPKKSIRLVSLYP